MGSKRRSGLSLSLESAEVESTRGSVTPSETPFSVGGKRSRTLLNTVTLCP